MMKRAMVDVHKVLPKHSSKLLVTVHDELGTSVPDKEAATALASVMNSCVTLLVPVSSDIELGPNWGELS